MAATRKPDQVPETPAEQTSETSADQQAPVTPQDHLGKPYEWGAEGPDAFDPAAADPQFPPFWIALRDLPVGAEMGNSAGYARAFAVGDRVPDEHVQRYGWQLFVAAPEGDWPPPNPVEPPPSTADAAPRNADPETEQK